jgi:hypothetical protein
LNTGSLSKAARRNPRNWEGSREDDEVVGDPEHLACIKVVVYLYNFPHNFFCRHTCLIQKNYVSLLLFMVHPLQK